VIVLAQRLDGFRPSPAGLMATKDAIGTLTLEQDEGGKGPKVTVAEYNLTPLEVRAKLLEEALFMIVEVADAIAAYRTGGQRHEGHQTQDGKATAGLLLPRLGIGLLIGLGIRQGNTGAIDHMDDSAQPEVFI
jgi:hypothetical protein